MRVCMHVRIKEMHVSDKCENIQNMWVPCMYVRLRMRLPPVCWCFVLEYAHYDLRYLACRSLSSNNLDT